MTLIRSSLVYGGSLKATNFLVCVALESDVQYKDELNSLIELQHMGIPLTFIHQSIGVAKTSNKFTAWFQFDHRKFDYMLWLDADILVLGDPLMEIQKHFNNRNSIMCAPELYDYMVRFPHVNQTALVWNPSLPAFHLLGNGERTSHGVCNTGVIFMHGSLLKDFLQALDLMKVAVNELNPFKRDRFLDSLLFVATVNALGVQITPLPYSLNFMTTFEVEIIEETQIDEVVLIHHLSDTEIYCISLDENGGNGDVVKQCKCMYHNEKAAANSKIFQKLSNVLTEEKCLFISGVKAEMGKRTSSENIENIFQTDQDQIKIANPSSPSPKPFEVEVAIRDTSDEFLFAHNIKCVWVWPLHNATVVVPTLADAVVDIGIACYCREPIEISADVTASDFSYCFNRTTVEVDLSAMAGNTQIPSQLVERECAVFNREEFRMRYKFQLDHISVSQVFGSRPQSAMAVTAALKLRLSIEAPSVIVVPTIDYIAYVHMNLVVSSLQTTGYLSYSVNPLMARTPASLPSQLRLYSFLNERTLVSRGLVYCCQTLKGVKTVEGLISSWDGQFLQIVLNVVPGRNSKHTDIIFNSLEYMASHFKEKCGLRIGRNMKKLGNLFITTKLSCIISIEESTIYAAVMSASAGSLDFVYIDSFDAHHGEVAYIRDVLKASFRSIITGGVLMGSRYSQRYFESIALSGMVDELSYSEQHAVLATHAESEHGNCDLLTNHFELSRLEVKDHATVLVDSTITTKKYFASECISSWYFIKIFSSKYHAGAV